MCKYFCTISGIVENIEVQYNGQPVHYKNKSRRDEMGRIVQCEETPSK